MEKENKKTVVFGASPNTSRYAFLASEMLQNAGFEFIPLGIKKGEVLGKEIVNLKDKPALKEIHTVTMYMSKVHQEQWQDYILSLNPKRIIFNPGAENHVLAQKAEAQGAEALEACTLVMLRTGQF